MLKYLNEFLALLKSRVEKQGPQELLSSADNILLTIFSADTSGLGTGQMQNFLFTFSTYCINSNRTSVALLP